MRDRPDTHRPLAIALFTHSVNPRGGVVHTLELGEALQARGHRVTLFVPTAPGEALYRRTACEVVGLPVPPAAPDLVAMAAQRIAAMEEALAQRLPLRRFDVLHAQDTLSANALATLQSRGVIGDWLRTLHHLDDYTAPRPKLWQQRGFEAARHVLCVSGTWRDALRRDHGIQAWRVRNGVNLQRFGGETDGSDAALRHRLGLPADRRVPVCLAIGGVEERKNTHRIVRAFAALRATHPEARLLIAGGASLLPHQAEHQRYLQALADTDLADGPGRAVQRLGTVADADMPALYRLADVLLMPSLTEGFGLVVLEALASGTPVVVSQRPPFTEHLHGPGIHWCDPLNPQSVALAAQAALAAGRIDASALCSDFDWAHSAAGHEALYRALLPSLLAAPQPLPAC